MLRALLVVGFMVSNWWWIAAVVGGAVLFVALLAGAFYLARRVGESLVIPGVSSCLVNH